jgi:tryptophan-rich sensory protein
VEAVIILLAMGMILVVLQMVIYHAVHPGAALLVGPILICFPYALSRALTTRLTRLSGKKQEI